MTLGSLFDGIGGFPLAAVHCGGVPVWASEIEPFPMRVTKLRFPDMLHVGDITKLDGAKLIIFCLLMTEKTDSLFYNIKAISV